MAEHSGLADFNEHAECVVCWSDTRRRCSPCGDPVCENCGCPNGCEHELRDGNGIWTPFAGTVDVAA
jgi:hypothetical protein